MVHAAGSRPATPRRQGNNATTTICPPFRSGRTLQAKRSSPEQLGSCRTLRRVSSFAFEAERRGTMHLMRGRPKKRGVSMWCVFVFCSPWDMATIHETQTRKMVFRRFPPAISAMGKMSFFVFAMSSRKYPETPKIHAVHLEARASGSPSPIAVSFLRCQRGVTFCPKKCLSFSSELESKALPSCSISTSFVTLAMGPATLGNESCAANHLTACAYIMSCRMYNDSTMCYHEMRFRIHSW